MLQSTIAAFTFWTSYEREVLFLVSKKNTTMAIESGAFFRLLINFFDENLEWNQVVHFHFG